MVDSGVTMVMVNDCSQQTSVMRKINLIDLMCGISTALDYVSPHVTGHHRRVAMGSAVIGNGLGLSSESLMDLILAALLHDIGAFSMNVALDGLDFDSDLTEHAVAGHRLLRGHPFLARASRMILHHHTPWQDLRELGKEGDEETLLLANVINLADRIDILRRGRGYERSREEVREIASRITEEMVAPEVLRTFLEMADNGLFWGLVEDGGDSLHNVLGKDLLSQHIPMTELLAFSDFFTHIIDFRSRHTATHSKGVSETAVQLAGLAGMSKREQEYMRLAGNLHDIGKLAVPVRLLDKPGKLDAPEYVKVQDHMRVADVVLRSIPGLDEIADWACQHHERLNGKGYPHGLAADELSLGSRIMQVADVFTAITEDRPYRKGMSREKTVGVLTSMADNGFLDKDIVRLAVDNYERIDAIRRIVQIRALTEFQRFTSMVR